MAGSPAGKVSMGLFTKKAIASGHKAFPGKISFQQIAARLLVPVSSHVLSGIRTLENTIDKHLLFASGRCSPEDRVSLPSGTAIYKKHLHLSGSLYARGGFSQLSHEACSPLSS